MTSKEVVESKIKARVEGRRLEQHQKTGEAIWGVPELAKVRQFM